MAVINLGDSKRKLLVSKTYYNGRDETWSDSIWGFMNGGRPAGEPFE